MTNYIVADNQELTRMGLESLIRRDAEARVYYASDKEQLIRLLGRLRLCTVLIDYTLFDFADVDQFLVVVERFGLASWLLVCDDLTNSDVRRLLFSSNRISLVFKDSPLQHIVEAIEAANGRSRYVCQRATEVLLLRGQEDFTSQKLTPTEVEILRCIAQGKTTKEMAAERQSSIHTINTHRKNIFKKLGVNTAHEAIKASLRAGLVDSAEFYI